MIIDCTNVENPYEYVAYILKEEITKKEGCRCPGTYIVNIETDACGCCNTVMEWDTDDSVIWEDDWWEGGPIVKIHGYIEICEVMVPYNL